MFEYEVVSVKKTRKGHIKMDWKMSLGMNSPLYPMLLTSYTVVPEVGDWFKGQGWSPGQMTYMSNGRLYRMVDDEELIEIGETE